MRNRETLERQAHSFDEGRRSAQRGTAQVSVLTRVRQRLNLRLRARIEEFPDHLSARWLASRDGLWRKFARAALPAPFWVVALTWSARRLAPTHYGLAMLEVLLMARRHGWVAAAPLARARAAALLPDDLEAAWLARARAAALLPPVQAGTSCSFVVPKTPRPTWLPVETAQRIVIYTACLGEAGPPAPIFGLPEGVRCLCFTDRAQQVHGWEMHPTALSLGEIKAMPQQALALIAPEAEFSLWLDPGRETVGNLHTFFGRWLDGEDLVMARHAAVPDWHALAERALIEGAKGKVLDAVLTEVEACVAQDIPRGRGSCDTGVIWRRHGARNLVELGDAWLALRPPDAGPADDIAFYRLLQGPNAPEAQPAILPPALTAAHDDARDSAFTAPVPRFRAPVHGRARKGKLPITFLYGKGKLHFGATLLRSLQLSELIAARFPDDYEVTFTEDIAAVQGQVVIVNAIPLHQYDVDELANLAARNIALIGDWLDRKVYPEKVNVLSANMAFCLRQAFDLSRILPERPTFHVTHHVNTAIPSISPPQDRLRIGYFGALYNTWCPGSLTKAIDIVDVRYSDEVWIQNLSRYNCHWLVRVEPPGHLSLKGGWKPFLKGFVAARCGSPVITTRDDSQAIHYLGDDYPFYADGVTAADLESAYARVSDAFGGPDWQMAIEIMRQTAERSSNEQVCLEFKTMLDTLLGPSR